MGFAMPFFPIYAAETLADGRFQGWNLEERGAWFTLLCCNWNDGDIPESQTVLARLLGVEGGDMARIWSAIGDRFCPAPGKPGRLVCPRLEEERDHAIQLSEKRADAGARGAKARWGKGNRPDGKRMRLPSQPDGKANATAMRPQCPVPSPPSVPSPETTTTPPAREAGAADRVALLHGRDETLAQKYPRTAALIAECDRVKCPAAWAKDAETRASVEAAIGDQNVAAVAVRVCVEIAESGKPWLGFHLAAIRGVKKHSKPTHSAIAAPAPHEAFGHGGERVID